MFKESQFEPKPDNWLDKGTETGQKNRQKLAESIKKARKGLHEVDLYDMNRNFGKVEKQTGLDIKSYVDKEFSQENFDYLDVGSGDLRFAEEMKDTYKSRVNVSALNPFHPDVEAGGVKSERWSSFIKKTKESAKKKNLGSGAVHKQIKKISEAAGRRKKIDEYHVGMLETFEPGKQYDLITDWCAAALYSPFRVRKEEEIENGTRDRVIDRYFDLVKTGGRVLIRLDSGEYPIIKKYVETRFGRQSKIAQEQGVHFVAKEISGTNVLELKKIESE